MVAIFQEVVLRTESEGLTIGNRLGPLEINLHSSLKNNILKIDILKKYMVKMVFLLIKKYSSSKLQSLWPRWLTTVNYNS